MSPMTRDFSIIGTISVIEKSQIMNFSICVFEFSPEVDDTILERLQTFKKKISEPRPKNLFSQRQNAKRPMNF